MNTFDYSSGQIARQLVAAVIGWVKKRDPRVVHLRELGYGGGTTLPKRVFSLLLVGGLLAVGAVAVGATRGGNDPADSAESSASAPVFGAETDHLDDIQIEPVTLGRPKDKTDDVQTATERASRAQASDSEDLRAVQPRFYNPFYVFSIDPITQVRTYPLAEPPGIVVDLIDIAEPAEEPKRFVGEDERVLSVRRRVMPFGVRYILTLKNPVRRIETFHEGSVVMVFPQS